MEHLEQHQSEDTKDARAAKVNDAG
jgi:hypothetical protein